MIIRFALFATLAIPCALPAQIRASELGTMTQTIDGTKITVEYSRPRSRGRDPLFGTKAVRWGETWTPGANWATTLELNKNVKIDGKPVANQVVVAGGRPPRGGRLAERRVRTGADGIARIRITDRGQWYVKFINMVRVVSDTMARPAGAPALDYESKWATLTFEIR